MTISSARQACRARPLKQVMVTEVHEHYTNLVYCQASAGHCEIVSSSTSEENDQAVQERWGPFNPNRSSGASRRTNRDRESANRFRE